MVVPGISSQSGQPYVLTSHSVNELAFLRSFNCASLVLGTFLALALLPGSHSTQHAEWDGSAGMVCSIVGSSIHMYSCSLQLLVHLHQLNAATASICAASAGLSVQSFTVAITLNHIMIL
jgi:hypothetical protein